MKSPQALVDIFRKNGLRITPQRRAIFDLLAKEDSHPSVDEIYQQVKITMPDLSRATVYNTVHALVSLGELYEVEELGEPTTRYDPRTEQHFHLYCEGCHKLLDVEGGMEQVSPPSEKLRGFEISRSQITFYGLCPDCQNRKKSL